MVEFLEDCSGELDPSPLDLNTSCVKSVRSDKPQSSERGGEARASLGENVALLTSREQRWTDRDRWEI